MISLVQILPVGNALRIFITPPVGAEAVRLLRRTADTFTGYNDVGAFLVSESLDHAVIDTTGLVNGQSYFYKAYALVAGQWIASPTATGTPNAIYQDESVQVVEFIRERLAAGLLVEVQRGALQHELGKIPVLIASPTFEDTKWPVVTIHVAADSSDNRFLGETIDPDWFDADAFEWVGTEGWLSSVRLNIAGWALNADVRAALRKAIKRIIMANLPVFDERGMYQIMMNQQDVDDFQSYSAPVYQSVAQFSCLARSAVSAVEGAVREVISTPVVPAVYQP